MEDIISLLLLNEIASHERRKKRIYINQIFLDREKYGFYKTLIPSLIKNERLNLDYDFTSYVKMDYERFCFLLSFIKDDLLPKGPCRNDFIVPEMKLMICLRYLTAADSFQTLSFCFRIASNTVSLIIKEVCDRIIVRLGLIYLRTPNTESEWNRIKEKFLFDWGFPNTGGCIDGKHIPIYKPVNSGSEFLNYKSITLI